MLHTNIRLLQEKNIYINGYTRLPSHPVLRRSSVYLYTHFHKYLFKQEAKSDEVLIPLSTILETNSVDDALRASRVVIQEEEAERDKILRLFAIDCAYIVLGHFEERFPGDRRPREALEGAVKFIDGLETKENLITFTWVIDGIINTIKPIAYLEPGSLRVVQAVYAAGWALEALIGVNEPEVSCCVLECASRAASNIVGIDDDDDRKLQKELLLEYLATAPNKPIWWNMRENAIKKLIENYQKTLADID